MSVLLCLSAHFVTLHPWNTIPVLVRGGNERFQGHLQPPRVPSVMAAFTAQKVEPHKLPALNGVVRITLHSLYSPVPSLKCLKSGEERRKTLFFFLFWQLYSSNLVWVCIRSVCVNDSWGIFSQVLLCTSSTRIVAWALRSHPQHICFYLSHNSNKVVN